MAFIGKSLLAGASKYIGKAIKAGSYVGKAIPQISKGLTHIQRLASNSAIQEAGKSIGIGPSVFNRVGSIAGTTNTVLGAVPGVAAAVVYAIPPGIRLTALGIKQVSAETIEAATTFGATPRQLLFGVRVPLALPSIILAVNQMVMMVLAMAIIAGMVGGEGLGYRAVEALTRSNTGLGVEVGLAIVFMATILDRLTQAMARKLQPPTSN